MENLAVFFVAGGQLFYHNIGTAGCQGNDSNRVSILFMKANGLIFCSAKVEQIQKIQTVKEVMDDLEFAE